jgi:hypothetical protein
LYAQGGIIHKAEGGSMDTPDLAQSRVDVNQYKNPALMDNIGINEALDMSPKQFVNPDPKMAGSLPVGGIDKVGGLPIGGVDQSSAPGMQFAPQQGQPDQQGAPQGGLPQTGGQPPSAGASSPAQHSNILSLTPQGRALGAMAPQGMATGGSAKHRADIRFRLDQLENNDNVGHYASKGYVHHTDINPHPEVGTRYQTIDKANLEPIHPIDPESMLHGSFGISPWDKTGSHTVTHVSGHELLDPVDLEAGQNFARMKANVAAGRGGASGQKVVEGQQERISRAHAHNIGTGGSGKIYTSPSTMAQTSAFFSHMPIEIQLHLLNRAALEGRLTPEHLDQLNSAMKKKKGMENFIGFEHPQIWEHLTKNTVSPVKSVGKLRTAMSQVLGSKEGQKLLDYNLEDLLNATTDPDLMHTPTGYTGRILLEGYPNKVTGPSPFMDPNHTSYSTGHRQTYIGGSTHAPVEAWMPDSFEAERNRMIAENPELKDIPEKSLRSQVINSLAWTKKPVGYQRVNERVLRNLDRFKEGIKAGDISPDDLQGVLDMYKRKYGGFKKGGKVSLTEMKLELARKSKKAK